FHTWARNDEEWQVGWPAQPFKVDHQTVQYFRQFLNHSIELASPHPDPLPVDRRVRPPIDDHAPVRSHLDPIPVTPGSRKHFKVALAVSGSIRIVPEIEGHRGHRLGNNQLPYLIHHRFPRFVECFDRRAKTAALDLAR